MRRFSVVILSFFVGLFAGAYITSWLINNSNNANRIDILNISNLVNYEQLIQIVTEENDNYILLGSKETINVKFRLDSDIKIYWVSTEYSLSNEKEKILILEVDSTKTSTRYKIERNNISIEFNKK